MEKKFYHIRMIDHSLGVYNQKIKWQYHDKVLACYKEVDYFLETVQFKLDTF